MAVASRQCYQSRLHEYSNLLYELYVLECFESIFPDKFKKAVRMTDAQNREFESEGWGFESLRWQDIFFSENILIEFHTNVLVVETCIL